MKTIKLIASFTLILAMALTLAACGGGTPAETTGTTAGTTAAPSTTAATTEATTEAATEATTAAPSMADAALEDILAEMYAKAEVDDDTRAWLTGDYMATTEVNADNVNYFLGLNSLDGIERAIAHEPMMSSIAYSVCLVRVTEGTDVEKMKTDIRAGINPVKWICVGVEDKNIVVDNVGNVIVLIMWDSSDVLHSAFTAVMG